MFFQRPNRKHRHSFLVDLQNVYGFNTYRKIIMIIIGVKLYCEIMDKPYLYFQSYKLNILKRSSFCLYIMHYFKGVLGMIVFIPIYTNFHFCEFVFNPHHVI